MTVIDADTSLQNLQVSTVERQEEHYIYSVGSRYSVASDIEISQSWFWTAEWQAGEHRATNDIEIGRGVFYDTAEEFLNSL